MTDTVTTVAITAGMSHCHRDRGIAVGVAAAAVAGATAIALHSLSTYRAAEMSDTRSRRSFARHLWINVRKAGGKSDGSRVQSGSIFSTLANVSLMSSPSNAR